MGRATPRVFFLSRLAGLLLMGRRLELSGAVGRADRLRRVSLRLFDTATRELRDFIAARERARSACTSVDSRRRARRTSGTSASPSLSTCCGAGSRRATATSHAVRNVTDIDDKVLRKAAEAGEDWFALTYRNERLTTEALDALGVKPATYEPRATGHVPDMVSLMETLVEKGHAYAAPDGSGDVYFDVRSWPEYGSLSNQSLDDMVSADDADPRGKRDPRDFALWKGRKSDEPRERVLADPVRGRSPRVAPRVLRDGPALARRRVRHPRRRHRPALPAPRERAGAVAGGGARLRPLLAAQRLGHRQGPEDGQVARQRPRGAAPARGRPGRSCCATTSRRRTTGR